MTIPVTPIQEIEMTNAIRSSTTDKRDEVFLLKGYQQMHQH